MKNKIKIFSFASGFIEEFEPKINEWLATVDADKPIVVTCGGVNEYGTSYINITMVFYYGEK